MGHLILALTLFLPTQPAVETISVPGLCNHCWHKEQIGANGFTWADAEDVCCWCGSHERKHGTRHLPEIMNIRSADKTTEGATLIVSPDQVIDLKPSMPMFELTLTPEDAKTIRRLLDMLGKFLKD